MDILTYSKIILEKVSFDEGLLAKEYRKFSAQLAESERIDLNEWCLQNFGQKFSSVIC